MRFGAAIPNCREGKVYPPGFTTPEVLTELAVTAEASGFHSLWANDLQSTFDEALSGQARATPNFFEAQTTLAYLAARTERIRFVTSAVTVPLRDPILLAKQVATLDVLSGGRYALGLGLGGKRTELDRLRGRFSSSINRGRWLEESLELIEKLLTEQVVDHDGEYFSVEGAEVFPKPLQRPFPLYLTGAGDEMLRRTARWGAGWIHMHITPEQLTERIQALHEACAKADRDPAEIEVCLQFDVLVAPTREEARQRWENSLAAGLGAARGRSAETSYIVGSPDDVVARLGQYQDAGMQHVGLIPSAHTPEQLIEQVRLLGEQVLPRFA
ncbi:LLM class flavin-dependent oxidoreductase [Jiangella asiatica]|uniref:LLM class flavin-dependent oxidoreductase n=1 Tax=Jiangella asiatica TaxID=2530372 RepID=A0A4R5DCH5_9ACTN|nr:LLM class flavin-dependent oxidoreductase [Jiangella asiatica]TDE09324.1 LLM class flavin-dependent oxidoreductase [Jiangella asiatica]